MADERVPVIRGKRPAVSKRAKDARIHAEASLVIDRIGGTAAASRLIGVSMPAIAKWRYHGINERALGIIRGENPAALLNTRWHAQAEPQEA